MSSWTSARSDGIFRQYGLTKFDDLYNSAPSILDLINADNLLIVSMLNEILEALAKRGNVVILGRAGFAVLGEYADVLNVHIQAPFSERVQRVMAREGLTDLAASRGAGATRTTTCTANMSRGSITSSGMIRPTSIWSSTTGSLSSGRGRETDRGSGPSLDQKAQARMRSRPHRLQVDPVLADAVAKTMAGRIAQAPA